MLLHFTRTLVAAIALLHLWILVVEMFLWDKAIGRRMFGLAPDFAKATRTLAANQGLYNGFLAAGLLWGLSRGDAGGAITAFFLACVLVAGIFGALTSSIKILYVQTLPAGTALLLLALS